MKLEIEEMRNHLISFVNKDDLDARRLYLILLALRLGQETEANEMGILEASEYLREVISHFKRFLSCESLIEIVKKKIEGDAKNLSAKPIDQKKKNTMKIIVEAYYGP